MSSVNSQSPLVGLSPRLPWSPPCLPRVECCRDFWLTTNKFVSMYKIFSGETLLFWQLWGVKFKQEVMIILVLVVECWYVCQDTGQGRYQTNSLCFTSQEVLLYYCMKMFALQLDIFGCKIPGGHQTSSFWDKLLFLQKSIKRISSESSITRRLSCLDSFVGHKRQLMEQETKQKPGGESCWW